MHRWVWPVVLQRFEVLLVVGYLAGITAGGVIAPAAGAFVNELFPTSVRASVAGWNIAGAVLGAVAGLVVFGAVADVGNRFAPAALVTFLPAMAMSALVWLLPETRGREPESLWPVFPSRRPDGTGNPMVFVFQLGVTAVLVGVAYAVVASFTTPFTIGADLVTASPRARRRGLAVRIVRQRPSTTSGRADPMDRPGSGLRPFRKPTATKRPLVRPLVVGLAGHGRIGPGLGAVRLQPNAPSCVSQP